MDACDLSRYSICLPLFGGRGAHRIVGSQRVHTTCLTLRAPRDYRLSKLSLPSSKILNNLLIKGDLALLWMLQLTKIQSKRRARKHYANHIINLSNRERKRHVYLHDSLQKLQKSDILSILVRARLGGRRICKNCTYIV